MLTDAALDDLRRFGPDAARRVLLRLRALADEPLSGAPLASEVSGFRRLVLESARRVVYEVRGETITVWELWDGARLDGEAYAEALSRMQVADAPDVVELARLLARLGRATGTVPVASGRLRAPVPDWLARALVEQAGWHPLAVAAVDAETAFDAWNRAPRT